MSLSNEFIGDLIQQLEEADDNTKCYRLARAIERATTIAAYKHSAEICDERAKTASTIDGQLHAIDCGVDIRAEIARLEAEK